MYFKTLRRSGGADNKRGLCWVTIKLWKRWAWVSVKSIVNITLTKLNLYYILSFWYDNISFCVKENVRFQRTWIYCFWQFLQNNFKKRFESVQIIDHVLAQPGAKASPKINNDVIGSGGNWRSRERRENRERESDREKRKEIFQSLVLLFLAQINIITYVHVSARRLLNSSAPTQKIQFSRFWQNVLSKTTKLYFNTSLVVFDKTFCKQNYTVHTNFSSDVLLHRFYVFLPAKLMNHRCGPIEKPVKYMNSDNAVSPSTYSTVSCSSASSTV